MNSNKPMANPFGAFIGAQADESHNPINSMAANMMKDYAMG